MARKRSEEKRIEQSFKIGEANAALIPRLQRWCDHLRIEQISAGILAEMSGLPIGMLQVVCPHATKGLQAMRLMDVASYFVSQNCRACPHHKELHPDNVGREILRAVEEVHSEKAVSKAEASEPKRRLQGLVSGDFTHALSTAPTTEQSVLELVALLDESEHAKKAAQLLLQAAELAPEFFSQLACEVIAEHFAGIWHGGICAEVLTTIGQKRNSIPGVAVTAALRCVEHEFCHDEVLELLAHHIRSGGELPRVPVVARMIGHHGYGGGGEPFSQYPIAKSGQLELLHEIGERELDLLIHAFRRKLENPDKHSRIAASIAFRGLISVLPGLGQPLTDAFISSLELDDDDDRHHESADTHACDALAAIFVSAPQATQKQIETAFTSADPEIKKLLFRVYSSVVETESNRKEQLLGPKQTPVYLPTLLNAVIGAISATDKPLEVREQAAEILDRLAWHQPAVLLPNVDTVFGLLAMISHEQAIFVKANPGGDPKMPGYPRIERLKYDRICHELISVLETLTKQNPAQIHATLTGVLSPLNSKDHAHELLKVRLIGLFERLSRDNGLAPSIVPHLFKFLMDMDSVLIRSATLRGCIKMNF